jgi:hypothetical protein
VRRDYAQKRAGALEPRLARLAISAPAARPAGFVVTRDGTQVDDNALGVALYIDAGPHEIAASAPGFQAFTKTITVLDGKTETVAISGLTAVPAPTPDLPKSAIGDRVTTTEPADAGSPAGEDVAATEPRAAFWSTRKYIAIGAGAAGVAAAGVGLLFGAKASSAFSDAKALCGTGLTCAPADYDKGKQLIGDARSRALTSTVLVTAGGAAIIAGAIVFLTAPSAREQATARIVPVTHDRGAGLAILGRF